MTWLGLLLLVTYAGCSGVGSALDKLPPGVITLWMLIVLTSWQSLGRDKQLEKRIARLEHDS